MIGTYLAAFRTAGLDVLDCLEAPMVVDFSRGLFAGSEAAATAFWDGLPVVLVWSLEKPA